MPIVELIQTGLDGTTAGNSNSLDTGDSDLVVGVLAVPTLSGGASPRVTFLWEHSADNSNWYAYITESNITSAGGFRDRLGGTIASTNTNYRPMRYVRIRWTVGDQTAGTIDIFVQAIKLRREQVRAVL